MIAVEDVKIIKSFINLVIADPTTNGSRNI